MEKSANGGFISSDAGREGGDAIAGASIRGSACQRAERLAESIDLESSDTRQERGHRVLVVGDHFAL